MILNVTLPKLKNVPKPSQRELDLHKLANMVAEKHCLTGYELRLKRRKDNFVAARVEFSKTAVEKYRPAEIARYLGVDWSTVHHYLHHYKI